MKAVRSLPAMQRGAAHRQRGIAAIEFALVFMTIFFIIYGLATFGAVLYTQQVVSRAVEDGARAVPRLLSPPVAADDARIKAAVYDSLSAAGQALIDAANDAGGKDNIAVVLARVSGPAVPAARSWWPFRR